MFGEAWARLGYAHSLSATSTAEAVPALQRAYELLPPPSWYVITTSTGPPRFCKKSWKAAATHRWWTPRRRCWVASVADLLEALVVWDLPEPFVIELTVEDDDIDSYGHTNNAVYLKWLDQLAWAHADAVGAGPDVHEELRRGMALHQTELQYIAPALRGDRLLIGDWIVFSSGRVRAQRRFQIVRPADGTTLLRALGLYVCIDIDAGKPARMPASYRECYVVLPAVKKALESETWPFSISPSPLSL